MLKRFQPNNGKRTVLLFLLVLLGGGALLALRWGWPLILSLFLAALGLAAGVYYRAVALARDRQIQQDRQALENWRDRLLQSERARADEQRRLQAVLQLNRGLSEGFASPGELDARGLVENALAVITGLVGALGCSFVPVDEWEQPLPAFTYGQLPDPVLRAWSDLLASNMLRTRCGSCRVLESTPGSCPLHPQEIGNTLTVYCLPYAPLDSSGSAAEVPQPIYGNSGTEIPVTGRTRGVLHLYLPAGRTLDAETRIFLDELVREVVLSYQATRMRSQEQTTLRQLQMLRSSRDELSASLGVLLEGVLQALEIDFALLSLRPVPEAKFSGMRVLRGDISALPEGVYEEIVEQALDAALDGETAGAERIAPPAWLSLPLLLPEPLIKESAPARENGCAPLGVLLVGASHPYTFHPRQVAILQAVAAQAALLTENERMVRSLEYKVVIQERARLAREIHDGLAQTLAFLKLQSSQMQSYLAQGDISRLASVLKENYQVLADAYLDTRQAIDNLRLTAQSGLEQWLERLLQEFETSSGLVVKSDIQLLSEPPFRARFAPEVQAQLIRIVQEALSNVRKHAGARTVRVFLQERQGRRVLEISDDGRGFDVQDVPEITRHGLRGMRERAELIGADFDIISCPGQGTTIRLSLPVEAAGADSDPVAPYTEEEPFA